MKILLTCLSFALLGFPTAAADEINEQPRFSVFNAQLAEVRKQGAQEILRICAYPKGQKPPVDIANSIMETLSKADWDIEPLREYGDGRSKIVFLRVGGHLDPLLMVVDIDEWKWILAPGDETRLLGEERVREYRNAFDIFEKQWSR